MKRKYTPLLFVLMLCLFWLSLLLTFKTRSRHFSDQVSLPYTQITGIETLEIDLPCPQKSHSRIDIRFVNEPRVTVELHGIENPAAITGLFVRDGKRLIVRPEIRQKPDAANGDDTKTSATLPHDDGYWRIDSIRLPMHMRHVRTLDADLSIAGDGSARQHLPTLLVEAESASSHFSDLHIGALHIRNRPGQPHCEDDRPDSLETGRIWIGGSLAADELSIESSGGNIDLDNTQKLRHIRLHTTPETGITLDRMDAMQRLHWTPLPPADNGIAPAASSHTRRGPVPSIKAKNH